MPATLSYGFIIPIPRPTLKIRLIKVSWGLPKVLANQSFLGSGRLDPSMPFVMLISSLYPTGIGLVG